MVQQLIPLLRFDGYYVLTDLTGVPDILSRIKPIFRSLARGRRRSRRWPSSSRGYAWGHELPAGVDPDVLALLFSWVLMSAPRVMGTFHDSFGLQLDRVL